MILQARLITNPIFSFGKVDQTFATRVRRALTEDELGILFLALTLLFPASLPYVDGNRSEIWREVGSLGSGQPFQQQEGTLNLNFSSQNKAKGNPFASPPG